MADRLRAGLGERLRSGEILIGTFIKAPSLQIAEILAASELDLICLDAEHGPFDRAGTDLCLAALHAAGMPSLVRIPALAAEHLSAALDGGADGILAPHICDAGQAAELVRLAHFGPGGRGFAGGVRASGYGRESSADYLARSRARTLTIAQIEDVRALDNLEAIVATSGLDCLFIGMMDLSLSMGAAGPAEAQVVRAAERVCAAAAAAAMPLGIYIPERGDMAAWARRGVRLFLLESEQQFVRSGAAALAAAARSAG